MWFVRGEVVRTFAEAEEALERSLPTYERREPQQRFAAAVENALSTGKALLAEAGCGTGKSFGYLIPAILSGKRVVISTATKALQDQLATGDLPFLQEHLGVDFTWAVLKGRSNYLCQSALNDTESNGKAVPVTVRSSVTVRTQDPDFNGERDNLGFDVDNTDWINLTVSSDECPGKKTCPFGDVCYAEKAKAAAEEAQIVVVNHALAMTDLAVELASDGAVKMLGNYDYIIFDEAHELEEYASGVFGHRVTRVGLVSLATQARNFAQRVGGDIDTDAVSLAANNLWDVLEEGRLRPASVTENEDQWVALVNSLTDLAEGVSKLSAWVGETERNKFLRLERRVQTTARKVFDLVTVDWNSVVRWVETEKTRRGEEVLVIKSAPIDLSDILRSALFDNVTAVLVSATLSVGGKFDYIAGRLGVDDYDELDVGTPFDFPEQAVLYVPDREFPDPSKDQGGWASMSIARMGQLVEQSGGGALLLFTSNRAMRRAHESLADTLEARGLTVLKQGDAPNKALAAEFKADTHSVLFATRSFFTGVDFQGDTLRLVVVDKLPFPVPTEPLTEARCEAIKAGGGQDFTEYTVPVMTLILKQALGRLIRHRDDKGVMAILDPRLRTKGYGKLIMNSLPEATQVDDVAEAVNYELVEAA